MGKYKTVYLPDLENKETENCDVYKSNGVIRTIVNPQKEVVFKNLSGFRQDLELAQECKYIWDDMGYSGSPSSPASFFREEFASKSRTYASHNFAIREYSHGGWAENFISGSVFGNLYKYDLIKAYLWSGSKGLPANIKCYKKGDQNYIGIFKSEENRPDLPVYFRGDKFLVTGEDVRTYDLKGEIVWGYSWNDLEVAPMMDIYKYQNILPQKGYKLLTQSYWGIWHSQNALKVKYRNGKKRKQYNNLCNLIWSNIIIHRVIRKVWEQAKYSGILVQTDSVITKRKIDQSNLIGGWKLEREYKDGLFIKSANVYTPIGEYSKDLRQWEKHAGYRN